MKMEDTDLMKSAVEMTIEKIRKMAAETANYMNNHNRVPEDLKYYANNLADLAKNKSENLAANDALQKQLELVKDEIVSDLQKQLDLVEDEISKLDEEEKSMQKVITRQKKQIKVLKKENLQLKEEKELLTKKTAQLQVVQALTGTTILSVHRRNIHGLVGSEDEGTLRSFIVSNKKEDLPKFTYRLAKEVFKDK